MSSRPGVRGRLVSLLVVDSVPSFGAVFARSTFRRARRRFVPSSAMIRASTKRVLAACSSADRLRRLIAKYFRTRYYLDMSVVGVVDAAEQLEVSPRRVRQLLASGDLPGQRVGRSWVIDRADVQDLRRGGVGRPWSAASAWAVLDLAAGQDPELSPVERSRARKRLADHGLGGLVDQLRARAERRKMYAHPSALGRLGAESGVVRGGVSAVSEYNVDLIAGEEAEVYVRARNMSDLVDRYALDVESERPNVIVRVVDDDDWPFDDDARVAPWPVVAMDLLDARDERSRRAGFELIERHQ